MFQLSQQESSPLFGSPKISQGGTTLDGYFRAIRIFQQVVVLEFCQIPIFRYPELVF